MRLFFFISSLLALAGTSSAQAPIHIELGTVQYDPSTGNGSVPIMMTSTTPVAGFQFDLVFDSATVLTSVSGGLAETFGWFVSFGPTTGTVLGFDFPLSEIPPTAVLSELTTVGFNCGGCVCAAPEICIENPVFSDAGANSIPTNVGPCSMAGAGAMPATVFLYNGTAINLDTMVAGTAVIGAAWTATLTPQPTRAPGPWIILMRSSASAGPILDLGLFFALPPAGLSELQVGAGFIANFFPPAHGGGGSPSSFSAPVPLACSLVALPWFAQAVVFGDLPAGSGTLDPWFSSSAGGIVGTF